MESFHPTILRLKNEFEAHFKREERAAFSPSPGLSQELGRLTRDLETKRQLGALTDQEQEILQKLDELWEEISKYNQSPEKASVSGPRPMIYNLPQNQLLEDQGPQRPVIIPNISSEEADKIISHLNEQFEEKVMKKLRPSAAQAPAAGDFSAGIAPPSPGRNLQDYLVSIRADRPSLPFMDEDSQIDLSKLKPKSING